MYLFQHRGKFRPNLFHRPSPNPSKDPEDASPVVSRKPTKVNLRSEARSPPKAFGFMQRLRTKERQSMDESEHLNGRRSKESANEKEKGKHHDSPRSLAEEMRRITTVNFVPVPAANDPDIETDVLEVWFSGCHSGTRYSALFQSTYR